LANLTSDRPAIPGRKPSLGILASGGEVNILQSQFDKISLGRLKPVVGQPGKVSSCFSVRFSGFSGRHNGCLSSSPDRSEPLPHALYSERRSSAESGETDQR